MLNFKSFYFTTITLFSISSLQAVASFKLSPTLQRAYISWNEETGSIVFPYVEYKNHDETTQVISFFSNEKWFDTIVQIPSNISEFRIFLPTMKFGKGIKFTFNQEKCLFSSPNLSHLDQETLSEISCPMTPSFISDELYTINIKYINISGKPVYAQCLLKKEYSQECTHLVAISNIPK